MKSLQQYIVEAEQWISEPNPGDDFGIELEDGTLIETYVMAREDNAILLDATEEIYATLAEWADLQDEDENEELLEDQSGMIQLDKSIADAPVTPIDNMEEGEMKRAMHADAERMSLPDFQERYGYEDWIEEFWKNVNDVDEAKYMYEILRLAT
jgi:hypothetical protein